MRDLTKDFRKEVDKKVGDISFDLTAPVNEVTPHRADRPLRAVLHRGIEPC